MSFLANGRSVICLVIGSLFLLTFPAYASPESDLQAMKESLSKQETIIKSQKAALAEQKKKLAQQEKELRDTKTMIESLAQKVAALPDSKTPPASNEKDVSTQAKDNAPTLDLPKTAQLSAKEEQESRGTGKPKESKQSDAAPATGTSVIAPKKETTRPEVPVLANAGGVLTPKGVLMYENTLEYLNTTSNVFTFDGVKVAELVFIGVTNATTATRQVLQDSNRFRLGLTDRLEADVRVPYVYRNDRNTDTDTNTNVTTKTTIEGDGIGDIDGGIAYQFNDAKDGWPFLVGNLRYKANNADGPFDVTYNASNVATELPTGTGFHSVEASLTAIKVSDPAVLFGNLGYVYNAERSIDKTFGNTRILDVNPGDAINASAGFGFSVNKDLSFTLGYKHSYVFSTEQDSQAVSTGVYSTSESDAANVGALMVGGNYRINPIVSLGMNVEIGATREAPDVRVGFRIPIRLGTLF